MVEKVYRAIIIIPNENELNVGVYCKQLKENEFHGLGVKIFSNRNKLEITAESLGLEDDEYPGYVWQSCLASKGHAVICIGDCEPIINYLPHIISDNQYKWFLDNQKLFTNRKEDLSYIVFDKEENILENGSIHNKTDVIISMYECLARRNNLEESEDLKL